MNRFVLLALLITAAAPLDAQSFRTLSTTRQRRGEKTLTVNVEFAAGKFRMLREAGGALYRSRITYNEARFRPVADYDDGDLSLGLKTLSAKSNMSRRSHEYERQTMDFSISPEVPARLNLQFVAGEAELELGGLNLTRAEIKTGASQSRVSFSVPTVGVCESLSFQVGAAEFRGEQLGNARCRNFELLGGIGDLTLDFTGDWGPLTAVNGDIKVGMGTLRLELPRDVGVQIDVSRVLSSFDQSGFVKRGNGYYSSNWQSAKNRLHLDLTTALGSIEVGWR
ncbi:MAG: hypothetical protein HY700_20090 [Gemmatimonadetes bacterium]|nr:hypothetical protein [Gemmatimonadota bacterium]